MGAFADQFGPWALIAGGAQGIGEAYSRELARRGINVAILDASKPALDETVSQLSNEHDAQVIGLHIDLSAKDVATEVVSQLDGRQLGLLVYNAGLADVGPFYKSDSGLERERAKLGINVNGPFELTYEFARPMLKRGRGGIILMSSGAGLQGSPFYAHYAATRAYNLVLAASLWREFKPYGVDVLGVAAGMTLSTAAEGYQHLDTSGFQTTDELVAEALEALGQQPTLIAGEMNRKGRDYLRDMAEPDLIEVMASHAINNFLDGNEPPQNI